MTGPQPLVPPAPPRTGAERTTQADPLGQWATPPNVPEGSTVLVERGAMWALVDAAWQVATSRDVHTGDDIVRKLQAIMRLFHVMHPVIATDDHGMAESTRKVLDGVHTARERARARAATPDDVQDGGPVDGADHIRPSYYAPGQGRVPGIECIDVVQHFGFNPGNVIKYVWRAGEKGDPLIDYRKARQYLDFEIAKIEKERNA